jgi:hypothetical protein
MAILGRRCFLAVLLGAPAACASPLIYTLTSGDGDGIQRTLYRIDVAGASSTRVDKLADGGFSFAGGLASGDRLYLLGHNGEASNPFTYSPLEKVQDLEGLYRSVFFPAAGGLVLEPAEGVWWTLTADGETYQPLVVSFDAGERPVRPSSDPNLVTGPPASKLTTSG